MFYLNDEEYKKMGVWLQDHDKVCQYALPENSGAIGGRITFCFTPTSLGTTIQIRCACGGTANLTDYSDW